MVYYKGLSHNARSMVDCARKTACEYGHSYVGTEHLVLAMLTGDYGLARQFLSNRNINVVLVRGQLEARLNGGNKTYLSKRDFSPDLLKCLEYAQIGAKASRSDKVETWHILTSLLEDETAGGTKMLVQLGLCLPMAVQECRMMSGESRMQYQEELPRVREQIKTHMIDKYSQDLTRAAVAGNLDPVIGRDAEITRIIEILCRRRKSNPCLVGDAGVGKTALAEGLALAIVHAKVPKQLLDKRILSLDLAAMVAGTKYRGDFEERFKTFLDEIARNKNAIVFIDEMHLIMGAGAAEGSIDASGILKPALARGEIQVMGATTTKEYTKYIEKDAALERRFAKVDIYEPSIEEAQCILQGLCARYEAYHNVRITKEALAAAVRLSARYVQGGFLPDKAIDIMDEACAEAKISMGDSGSDIVVDENNIADVVANICHIPKERVTMDVCEQLRGLEVALSASVVGQSEAVSSISNAIRRRRMGFGSQERPMGAYMFLGPTGVGKTQLAKSVAQLYFGTTKALLRYDMSEYMEAHTVSRLIGAPPGYVGFETSGQLTEAVRRHPYSLILFDEIEKAHPDICNILLQILEDGTLCDTEGRHIDFRNTLIILTSNIGSRHIASTAGAMGFGKADGNEEARKSAARREAIAYFRPELINRLDELLVFNRLSRDELCCICEMQLAESEERATAQNMHITHSRDIVEYLVDKACDGAYGARPLKRAIASEVEQCLVDMALAHGVDTGGSFELYVENSAVRIRNYSMPLTLLSTGS